MKKLMTTALVLASMCACQQKEQAPVPEARGGKITFEGQIAPMPLVDFTEKGSEEGLRAIELIGDQENGRAVKIRVNPSKFATSTVGIGGGLRWLVTGFGGKQMATFEPDTENGDNSSNRTGFSITEENGVQKIRGAYYASGNWSGVFQEGQYGMMLIGGEQKDSHTATFGNNFDQGVYNSNHKLVQTAIGASTDRDILLTSKMKRIEVYNDSSNGESGNETNNSCKLRVNLSPRGCIFAFSLSNETGYKIKVNSIEALNSANHPSPLYYTGSFNVREFLNGTHDQEEYSIPFLGEEKSGDFPIYSDENTLGLDLNNRTNSTGRFFLWGYPVSGNERKALLLKVKYQIYATDGTLIREMQSIIQKFNAPRANGWSDGTCYRAILKVKKKTEIEYIYTPKAIDMVRYRVWEDSMFDTLSGADLETMLNN